jgi:hypothetical protein
MTTAAQTSYYNNVEFVENDTVYKINDKQLIKRNNKDYYIYNVCKQLNKDSNCFIFVANILVDAKIAQKRTCKAIYEAIKELQN